MATITRGGAPRSRPRAGRAAAETPRPTVGEALKALDRIARLARDLKKVIRSEYDPGDRLAPLAVSMEDGGVPRLGVKCGRFAEGTVPKLLVKCEPEWRIRGSGPIPVDLRKIQVYARLLDIAFAGRRRPPRPTGGTRPQVQVRARSRTGLLPDNGEVLVVTRRC